MSRAILVFALGMFVAACDPSSDIPDGGDGGNPGADAGSDAGNEPGVPTVTGITPPSGSTLGATRPVILTFSEPMAPGSVTLDGTLASFATHAWTSPTTLTVSPSPAWPASGELASLNVSAQSAAGVPLAGPSSLSYSVDASPAEIAQTQPVDGAALGASSAISIRFSESIDPASFAGLGGTLASFVGSTAFSQDALENDTLTLQPASSWPDGLDQTLTIAAGLADLQGNSAGAFALSFDVDAVPPSLTAAVPTSGSVIAWDDGLQFSFDEPLAPAVGAHSVTGSLLGGSGLELAVSGSTLTLTPGGTWNGDSDRTVELVVRDLAGNASLPIALTYDVLDGAIHVHKSGADANPGTASEPKLTIAAGLTAATANGLGEVWVAEGTYNENLTVPTGVQLLGGYDAAGWSTPPSRTLYPTVITEPRAGTFLYTVDLSPDSGLQRFKVVTSASASGCSAVRLLQNLTGTQRVVDNELEARACSEANSIRATSELFNVEIRGNRLTSSGVTGTHHALRLAINGGAAPNVVIEDNEILVSTGAATSRGVEVSPNTSHAASGTITLRNNFIRGGAGINSSSGKSYGCMLTMNNLTYVLERNRIHGGTGATGTYGVYVSGSAQNTVLQGNAIHGGAPTLDTMDSVGAQLSGQAKIWNNVITGGGRVDPSITDGDSHALELFTPGALVINNVLHHGFLKRGASVRNNSTGVVLRNNIFLSGGAISGGLVVAVKEMNTNADFAELRNNHFEGFTAASHFRYQDYDGTGTGTCPGFANYDCYSSASDLNTESLTTQGAAGTADANTEGSAGSAGLEDVDGPDDSLSTLFDLNGELENRWWLGAGSALKTAGLDGSATGEGFGFEEDLTGATRTGNGTTGWSIGAYENDP